MPFQTGQVIGRVEKNKVEGPRLTPFERDVLKGAGWKPGDGVPDLTKTDFGKRAAEYADNIRKKAEKDIEGKSPVPDGTPPPKPGPNRDISELHPAERMEIENLLRQQGLPEESAVPEAGIKIVDDVSQKGFNPFLKAAEPAEPPQEAAEAPEPMGEPVDPAGADLAEKEPQRICARCGHIHGTPMVEVTDTDKYHYCQTILGSQRFRKVYEAYGGRLKFTFRSLTPLESNMAFDQADNDMATSKITTGMQYMRRLEDYRLAMALERLERQDKAPMEFQEVNELAYADDVFTTPLPQLIEFIHGKVFVSDHVRRTVGQHWMVFQQLLETLEAKARDPDFFDVTGP